MLSVLVGIVTSLLSFLVAFLFVTLLSNALRQLLADVTGNSGLPVLLASILTATLLAMIAVVLLQTVLDIFWVQQPIAIVLAAGVITACSALLRKFS